MSRNRVTAAALAEIQAKGLVGSAGPRRSGVAPGPWVVTMLHYTPVPLNDLIGVNKFVVHRIKEKDRRRIGDEMALARVPPATGKRRVTLRIVLGPKQRGCDGDAYWKVLLDSLVACRVLKDDNRQGVELMPVEFERGKSKAAILTLADIMG